MALSVFKTVKQSVLLVGFFLMGRKDSSLLGGNREGYDYAVGVERQGRTRDLFNQFSSWITHNMASFGRGVVQHGAHTEVTHMLTRSVPVIMHIDIQSQILLFKYLSFYSDSRELFV